MHLVKMRQIGIWLFLFVACKFDASHALCTTKHTPKARGLVWLHQAGARTVLSYMAASDDDESIDLKPVRLGGVDFWGKQKEIMEQMSASTDKSAKSVLRDKFSKRRLALVGDTAYFGFFIFCVLWTFFDNPFVAISYSFGAAMGLAYAFGLGKYVENLGGSIDDQGAMQGAGVGEARFAFLIVLFIVVSKFRSQGFLELPAIGGFFTYQLASLSQGLREIND
jgi:hypothetical protein